MKLVSHEDPDDLVDLDLSEVDPDLTEDEARQLDDALAEEEYGFAPAPARVQLSPESLKLIADYVRTPAQLMAMPPPTWFIEDILPAGPVTILHGESGCKKSFVLLDWFLCAAKGIGWHGKHIAKGRTLYIVGEGLSGMGKRVRAWADAHDTDVDDLPIAFVKQPINLFTLSPVAIQHWNAFVEYGQFRYVVVDTLHTNSSGADENSSKDMGKVFETAKLIAGNAQLFFAHHDPKAKGANTARGSGSIRDDADVVISLAKTGPLGSLLRAEKIKDAEDFAPIEIQFEISQSGAQGSLYVRSIASGNVADLPKPKSAVDRCEDAIIEYNLDPDIGPGQLKQELDLLSFSFGKNTVGMAFRNLKRNAHEADLLARRATKGNTEAYQPPKDDTDD